MNAVNLNIPFFAKPANVQPANKDSGTPSSIFTPAPSVETAGSIASAAPCSGSSFSSTC